MGVWNVPSASHRSCQASSISCASAGVYRCGGTPSAVGSVLGWLAVWLMVGAPGSSGARTGGGQKKTPHAWRGRRAVRSVSGQHGRRSRSRPVTGPAYRATAANRPSGGYPGGHPSEAKPARLESSRGAPLPMRPFVEQERPVPGRRGVAASPWPLFLTVAFVLAFATGVVGRPPGDGLGPALRRRPVQHALRVRGRWPAGWRRGACVRSASPGGRSPGACCSAAWPTPCGRWAAGTEGNGPYPPAIDVLAFAGLPAALRHDGRADPRPRSALPPEHVARRRHRRPRHHGGRGGLPDRALPRSGARPGAVARWSNSPCRRWTCSCWPCSWPSARSSACAWTGPCSWSSPRSVMVLIGDVSLFP